jgi:AraC-like DNA-binding protein
VRTLHEGGCYAINFEAELEDEPFSVVLRDRESLQKCFRTACAEWKAHEPTRHTASLRALYEGIYLATRAAEQEYMPSDRQDRILPAVALMEREFANEGLTVTRLAEACGMSEVYFRKIFLHKFGVSPKEYLIRKRMAYARQLLSSGQFDVAEVARLSGYGEPCHFSREFKKRQGVSPREF